MPVALDTNDTIAAIASPTGPSPRGIVRLSGPAAISVVLADYIPDGKQALPPRRARDGLRLVAGRRSAAAFAGDAGPLAGTAHLHRAGCGRDSSGRARRPS